MPGERVKLVGSNRSGDSAEKEGVFQQVFFSQLHRWPNSAREYVYVIIGGDFAGRKNSPAVARWERPATPGGAKSAPSRSPRLASARRCSRPRNGTGQGRLPQLPRLQPK